ncbi:hypothetical protein MKX08_000601 [Trichoderma sp. CBMAI-0020]|nr:hypothetical protein MKX08_000601 [Trichoderma sp. CBMAI-0020]
MVRKAIRK